MTEETKRGPRRRYVATIELQADTERDLIAHLFSIATNWDREGIALSSISGGYSSGHIIGITCDESVTHESWEAELEEYLKALRTRESNAT